MNEKIKIAVQKSGRLQKESEKILKDCGIHFNNGLNTLKVPAGNFPLEVLLLRDDDIPQYVSEGVADIGIVGENVMLEKQKEVAIVHRMGFAKCRLSIAIPKEQNYTGITDLNDMEIATSYPNILADFMAKNNIRANIREISGSVEIATGIGLANAICDLVSSGSTLFMNGLKEVEPILYSQAVMIAHRQLRPAQQQILDDLLFRIETLQKAKDFKYILLNAPDDKLDDIIRILPGMRSPTVLPLAEVGWSSVHSVIGESDFWEIIARLKDLGAQGILVTSIEKMVV